MTQRLEQLGVAKCLAFLWSTTTKTIRDTIYELLSEEQDCQNAETAEQRWRDWKSMTRRCVDRYIDAGPQRSGVVGPRAAEYPNTPVIIISELPIRNLRRVDTVRRFEYCLSLFRLKY